MSKRTVGIILTIASVVFCCLPGLALAGTGALGLFGTTTPEFVQPEGENVMLSTYLILGGMLCVGGLLMLVPLLVGFFTLRGAAEDDPGVQVSYVPPVQPRPSPAPFQPAGSSPVQPAAPASAPAASPEIDPAKRDVYNRLMALNRPTAPFRVIDGRSENADLIAEWKIVDAQWYEVFAKANLTKVFRVYIKIDTLQHEVRTFDREYTLTWRAGVPSLSVEASFFSGQMKSVSFGTAYAFTETLAPGQVYNYRFNTDEIKKPIKDTVISAGWLYRPALFGKF